MLYFRNGARGGKLVLITNRKSYMSFRLLPKSVTSNDLERRNGPYFSFLHRTRQLSKWIAPKWLKINVNILQQKCSPKHLVFGVSSLTMVRYTWYRQFKIIRVSLEFSPAPVWTHWIIYYCVYCGWHSLGGNEDSTHSASLIPQYLISCSQLRTADIPKSDQLLVC